MCISRCGRTGWRSIRASSSVPAAIPRCAAADPVACKSLARPQLQWVLASNRAHCALFRLWCWFVCRPSPPGTFFQPVPSMINSLLTRVFGSRNDRLLRQLNRIVVKINALEPELEKLSDAELQARTPQFRERIAAGESLDKLLPEAFAVCREASRRVMGMRHYDVQLIGGMVLHMGKIAEMRTGEGKTLVATLPVYLNALEGKGVHVVTVNDYLAKRDSEWMGKVYTFLGLTVGVVLSGG